MRLDNINNGYRLYIAYGQYMSFAEMHGICPTAQYIGTGYISNYKLTFQGAPGNGLENIIPCQSNKIPATIWGITMEDEMQLDTSYNYRFTYTKCRCDVFYQNNTYTAFTYVLNYQLLPLSSPSQSTKDVIKEGYSDNYINVRDWNPSII